MIAPQILNIIFFIALGLLGAYAHWFKKFWVDHTTKSTIAEYILGDFHTTLYALGSIAFSELGLSAANPDITMTAIISAVTVGYMFDSSINKAPDA